MTTLLDDRIQAAYANDSSDSPARGFDDVLRRRDRGEYVELGVARKRVRMRYWVAAAAAGVAWVAFARPSDDPITPQLRSAQHSVFLPDLLIAQAAENPTPASDSFAIRSVDGSLLKPGTWVYRRRPIGGAAGRPEWEDTVTVRAGVFNEDSAWLLIHSRRYLEHGGSLTAPSETIWVRKADLWPLARTVRLAAGFVLKDVFTADSSVSVFEADGNTTTRAPGLSPLLGPGVMGMEGMRALLQVVPLTAEWRGSFRVLGVSRDGSAVDFRLELRVRGSEQISVPAGTFESWRVTFGDQERGFAFWVSKRDHWIVKLGPQPEGIRHPASEDVVLVSVHAEE